VRSGPTGAWSTLHRGAVGGARGTTRTLNREAVYDDNSAAATRTYGAAVWMDVRKGRQPRPGPQLAVPDGRHDPNVDFTRR